MFTNGDSTSIIVGRNGVFYDKDGNEWDATVTKVIVNPISLREAFFMPYRKLSSMIEDQIAKRASDADKKSEEKLTKTATTITTADKVTATEKQAQSSKKLDLGTIALLGTAIGGVSALVGGVLQALFGLGMWLPLGVLGILLMISCPSIIITALKLRKRSIGPVLEANGWAINQRLRINISFGGSMTKLAHIPVGSRLVGTDPFAEKKTGKKWFIAIVTITIIPLIFAFILRFFYAVTNRRNFYHYD